MCSFYPSTFNATSVRADPSARERTNTNNNVVPGVKKRRFGVLAQCLDFSDLIPTCIRFRVGPSVEPCNFLIVRANLSLLSTPKSIS